MEGFGRKQGASIIDTQGVGGMRRLTPEGFQWEREVEKRGGEGGRRGIQSGEKGESPCSKRRRREGLVGKND